MKVVIDVPEERYKDIQRIAGVQLDRRTDTVEQIVAKGTPIEQTDGVITELEKIKAEIEKIILFEESCNESATLAYECLDIVDKELLSCKARKKNEYGKSNSNFAKSQIPLETTTP